MLSLGRVLPMSVPLPVSRDGELTFGADFYVQLYCTSHGIDSTVAFYTVRARQCSGMSEFGLNRYQVAVVNASSIPGRVLLALLADRFGCFNLLIACGLGTAAIVFGLYGIHTLPGILVFSVLSGFFSGGCECMARLAFSPS